MPFHQLKVTHLLKTTRDAVVVTLKAKEPDQFAFTQGQYLTFRKKFDDQELRRCYSICSSPHEEVLQVAIKRVEGGAFSTWANSDLQEGDTLEAMPPMGKFYSNQFEQNKDHPAHYVLFATGSGITPILSILKAGLKNQTDARFTLVYGNRNPNTIMFREALEDLKNRYLGRLSLLHVLTDSAQDIDLFHGRIDRNKTDALLKSWLDPNSITAAFLCGPEPMMHSVKASLESNGVGKECIRMELFTGGQQGQVKQRVPISKNLRSNVNARVTLGGDTHAITTDTRKSLLDAALEHDIDAPYACRAGICSTCIAKVLEGDVEMIANHALQDDEVNAGYVLTCQCYPTSDTTTVVWDYDQAGH